ncbi:hypothetical protein VTN31DRAFT_6512 [Thermomyces dupontii]|uniref:uncharacterized protein n=1 Tax=Talaromyces thermophilus TaxID=28565 RepID=UPI0037426F92
MPPRRSNGRSAAGPKKSQQQSTLSFGAKSRITKPTTSTPGKPSKSVSEPAAKEIIAEATTPETPASPELSEEPIPPVTEEPQPQTEEERRALQIADAQLRKYWSNEEKSRKTPRVHQDGVDLHEKILRHFDLSSQYGPCIGISRLQRWHRAHNLDLNPPIEVLAVLLKGDKKGVRDTAYIDELIS